MIRKPQSRALIEKHSSNKRLSRKHRPFWLPASNFYILAAAVAVACFFLVWAILNAGEEEMPLVSAGLLASAILAGAVVLREIVIRSARYKLMLAQDRIDRNVKTVRLYNPNLQPFDKLTIEQNKRILREIEQRSRAADLLERNSEDHWQAFEFCHDYLHQNDRELKLANYGSPRINVLRESRERVGDLHKHHLLKWSALEARARLREAAASASVSSKLENANKALMVVDSALEFYPDEPELLDSQGAIKDFAVKVKVSHWVEQAERAAFKKNYKRALDHYRDALFYLGRDNIRSEERNLIADKINLEIENLRKFLH